MPRAKQRRICRRTYRASKLPDKLPDNQPPPVAHAPAPKSDLREYLLWLLFSFGASLLFLEILNWAARPY